MGHYISGIVAKCDTLTTYAAAHDLHSPAHLSNGLGFLPLSEHHLDFLFPDPGEFDLSMSYLSDALKATLIELSSRGAVAFIETEYFGGQGAQGATVYEEAQCTFEPTSSEAGPISDAMRLLGVTLKPGQHDEFEAVGFCRHRNNDDWIEEAAQNQQAK